MAASNTTAFLDEHQGKNRLLLVFAPSRKAPSCAQQMRLLESASRQEFAERDLLLVEVFAEGRSCAGRRALNKETAAQLRQRFGVGVGGFCVILVGKDGAEKRRNEAPVDPDVLFRQIDALPTQ